MSGLFSKPKLPPLPPLPPVSDTAAIEAARRRELEAQRRARGRAATLLTGGLGDESDAPVAHKTLLGQ